MLLHDLAEHRLDRPGIADVALQVRGASQWSTGGGAGTGHDRCSRCDEGCGDAGTDAARSAGDEDHAVTKVE